MLGCRRLMSSLQPRQQLSGLPGSSLLLSLPVRASFAGQVDIGKHLWQVAGHYSIPLQSLKQNCCLIEDFGAGAAVGARLLRPKES